jgi:RNA polymerase sigma factor (TIGR02999 family)
MPAMTGDDRANATAIVAILGGDAAPAAASAEDLFPLVYERLRRLAHRQMSRETPGQTLQPTALVHEVYLKLVDQSRVNWKGRTHFFAVGARVMQRLLVDQARARGASKRGAGWLRVTLAQVVDASHEAGLDADQLLQLDAALEKLAELDERQARIVTLRFFGGLSVQEVAEVIGVSKRTVEGDWRHARAWLHNELSRGDRS